jgi:hypothetical protein
LKKLLSLGETIKYDENNDADFEDTHKINMRKGH